MQKRLDIFVALSISVVMEGARFNNVFRLDDATLRLTQISIATFRSIYDFSLPVCMSM